MQKFLGTLWPLVMPKLIKWKDSFLGGLTLVRKILGGLADMILLPIYAHYSFVHLIGSQK